MNVPAFKARLRHCPPSLPNRRPPSSYSSAARAFPTAAFQPQLSPIAGRHALQARGPASSSPALRRCFVSSPSPAHVPHAPPLRDMASYTFPTQKLAPLEDDSKIPLILVSCGSFSPITYLHLRMFEMCKDWAKNNTPFEVVGGYLSPVSDAYKKNGLTTADHRIEMCRLAAQESSWLMVDDWEAIKAEYTRTALVLDHFNLEINHHHGGIKTRSGQSKPVRIALLSGADLLDTMSHPGVWTHEDLDHILGRYGAFIIERSGTDIEAALSNLEQWRKCIYPIPQLIQNDVSSTKIRAFLNKDMSIRYLIPEPALKYIDQWGLFKPEGSSTPPNRSPTNSMSNGAHIDGVVKGVSTNS